MRTTRYSKLHKAKFAKNVLRMAFFLDGISKNKKSVLFRYFPVGTKKYLKYPSGQRMLLQLSKLAMFQSMPLLIQSYIQDLTYSYNQ